MCLHCDATSPSKRQEAGRRHRNAANGSGLDPVRSERLRTLIERTMAASLSAPPQSVPWPRPLQQYLLHPDRGGIAVTFARQVAMYLGHVGCGLTYTDAGRLYERDRTTAAHACTVVEQRRDDVRFDFHIELLECCVRLGLQQMDPALAALSKRARSAV
jgi:hypothetical protein